MDKKERPVLPMLIRKGTHDVEAFQNTTLRPIIKMQHDLLISCFEHYLQKRHIDFIELPLTKKKSLINAMFTKDMANKNYTLGLIIGHFSLEEYRYYAQHSSEIHKRISNIVQQRIEDTYL